MILPWLVTAYCTFVLSGCYVGHEFSLFKGSKKGTGAFPVPFKHFGRRSRLASLPYVSPLGISRGELILSVIARKIAVSLVIF